MTAIPPSLRFGLQPTLLILVATFWALNPEFEFTYLIAIVSVQLTLGLVEHRWPAREDWVVNVREKMLNILLVVILVIGSIAVAELYLSVLAEPLDRWREANNLDIWPHHWPLVLQMLTAFFASEFIWYWIHRAEHRWTIIWRASGHGAHHSFKRLNALNFGLNHPLELFFLAIAPMIVELVFGVGIAAAGAALLISTQASFAHTNIELNPKGIGWLFTTNRYHIRHHSIVLEESNTNYGCGAIIWDRVFCTFQDGDTAEAGTGPSEPNLWEKLLMPIKEPNDTAIAPK